ncbi:TPA: integrase, partial [Enterobacter hormaechei]
MLILITKRIRYTFLRDSIYYVQFCLPDGKMFRRSLGTDSHREANTLMIALMPSVLNVKAGACSPENLSKQIEELTQTRMLFRAQRASPDLYAKPSTKPINSVDVTDCDRSVLTLGEAWGRYVKDKGKSWTAAIHSANERYMEVMLTVLDAERDVRSITRQDIKHVMEAVTGLPKRVVQPYRAMTIE